ncbi:MAG: hypothetical protein ABMA13_21335, partial [Chthoniobacteraceae bacterium]
RRCQPSTQPTAVERSAPDTETGGELLKWQAKLLLQQFYRGEGQPTLHGGVRGVRRVRGFL